MRAAPSFQEFIGEHHYKSPSPGVSKALADEMGVDPDDLYVIDRASYKKQFDSISKRIEADCDFSRKVKVDGLTAEVDKETGCAKVGSTYVATGYYYELVTSPIKESRTGVYGTQKEAEAAAEKESKEEPGVVHVNRTKAGKFVLEDWFDSGSTVASYEGGRKK